MIITVKRNEMQPGCFRSLACVKPKSTLNAPYITLMDGTTVKKDSFFDGYSVYIPGDNLNVTYALLHYYNATGFINGATKEVK